MTSSRAVDGTGQVESAKEVAYRWLKARIGQQPRHEGTFITEGEVASETGVSRTPVREALLRLEAEGLLTIMKQKGAFIPPVSDAEAEDIMDARALIEAKCVQDILLPSPGLESTLDQILVDQQRALEDPGLFIEHDREFHRSLVRAAGNDVLLGFHESLRDRLVRIGLRAVAASPDRARRVIDEHRSIADALRAGDTDAANAALLAHLNSTMAALNVVPRRSGSSITRQ